MHGLVLFALAGLLANGPASETKSARFGDFAAYWTAGRCFLEGTNPYDPKVVSAIEAREGLAQTFVVWNPPFFFPLLAPFSLLPFVGGAIAWKLVNAGLAVGSAIVVGRRAGIPDSWAGVLGLTFLPVGFCLGYSQLSILALAGAVGYGWAIELGRPVLGGALLALCAIKPHIVCVLWLVPLLVGPTGFRIKTLLGLTAAIALLSLITAAWHPGILGAYVDAVRNPPELPPTNFYSATIGMWLRMETGLGAWTWIQFLPFAIAVFLFGRHLHQSREALPSFPTVELALLISSIVLPYGWHYDQVTLLPIYLRLWSDVVWRPDLRMTVVRRGMIAAGLVLFEVGQLAMLWTRASERLFVIWPLTLAMILGLSLSSIRKFQERK